MAIWLTTTSFETLMVRFYNGMSVTTDAFGASIVTTHMTRAEAAVMAALSSRYNVSDWNTSTSCPPEVRRVAEDICSYFIIRASNYQDGKVKNSYLEEFKTSFDDLKNLASGVNKLTDSTGSLIATKAATLISSNTENYPPIFALDDPTSWNVSQAQLDDIEAARG